MQNSYILFSSRGSVHVIHETMAVTFHFSCSCWHQKPENIRQNILIIFFYYYKLFNNLISITGQLSFLKRSATNTNFTIMINVIENLIISTCPPMVLWQNKCCCPASVLKAGGHTTIINSLLHLYFYYFIIILNIVFSVFPPPLNMFKRF